ncbi:hypothetical protein H6G18_14595 [Anabaena subtropica FACHB-260]|uniref:Uncharacterized protein n=1 Tax=Anabaena subtropica FACHB-260 TaxID=2692884 RepID=A0ABR8CQ98_9NOST|nr:hypothetical protein [Anabaena subtropica FACHB-260]
MLRVQEIASLFVKHLTLPFTIAIAFRSSLRLSYRIVKIYWQTKSDRQTQYYPGWRSLTTGSYAIAILIFSLLGTYNTISECVIPKRPKFS